jgi:hypothetical protein
MESPFRIETARALTNIAPCAMRKRDVQHPSPAPVQTRPRVGAPPDDSQPGRMAGGGMSGGALAAETSSGDDRRNRICAPGLFGGGVRQGCREHRRVPRAGLCRSRSRHADPASASGQSEASSFPAGRGSRGHQPDGVQQWRHRRLASPRGGGQAARRGRRECRRQQGFVRPHRRLCRRGRKGGAAWPTM